MYLTVLLSKFHCDGYDRFGEAVDRLRSYMAVQLREPRVLSCIGDVPLTRARLLPLLNDLTTNAGSPRSDVPPPPAAAPTMGNGAAAGACTENAEVGK